MHEGLEIRHLAGQHGADQRGLVVQIGAAPGLLCLDALTRGAQPLASLARRQGPELRRIKPGGGMGPVEAVYPVTCFVLNSAPSFGAGGFPESSSARSNRPELRIRSLARSLDT